MLKAYLLLSVVAVASLAPGVFGDEPSCNAHVVESCLEPGYGNNQKELVSTRAQAQYIGCCTRPDICSGVQMLASSMANPNLNTFNQMKEIVNRCHSTADVGLKFIPMDKESLRLALFTDASFANNDNLKSQLGFVLVLVDGNGRACIIHYGSSRCKELHVQ